MKINIEIPDHLIAEGKDIFVLAGQDLMAYWKPTEGVWHIKTVPCDACGACCKGCEHLTDDKLCALYSEVGMGRPFLCIVSLTTYRKSFSCQEEYS